MAIACGINFSLAVAEDGVLFSFGGNNHGNLGTGDTDNRWAPKIINVPNSPVRQVAAGDYHTGIVTEAGDLFMCGWGMFGQLGLGDHVHDRMLPTLVDRALFDGEAVLMVACSRVHTVVVTENGGVFTFGRGEFGVLGHGNDEDNLLVPRRIPAERFNGELIVMVAVGSEHTVALSEVGHVFTWGEGWSGQLGLGDSATLMAPQLVNPQMFGGDNVAFVAAGRHHTVAVTVKGRLYTWGSGNALGLGDGGKYEVPTLLEASMFEGPVAFDGLVVVMAACGDMHTLVVTQDGGLWACGIGERHQLGLDSNTNRNLFQRVVVGESFDQKVVAVAGGGKHSLAVTEDGALWTWGDGLRGQLGRVDSTSFVPVMVPRNRFGNKLIGRCRQLSYEHKLAFSMCLHERLGKNAHLLELKPELIKMILDEVKFRCHEKSQKRQLSDENKLAFAMCTHRRLGENSTFLELKPELTKMILGEAESRFQRESENEIGGLSEALSSLLINYP